MRCWYLVAVVAMVVGILIRRPRHTIGWAFPTIGLALFLAGDCVWASRTPNQSFVPFRSTADWRGLDQPFFDTKMRAAQPIDGSFDPGGHADLFWITFGALLRLACLHPSMKSMVRSASFDKSSSGAVVARFAEHCTTSVSPPTA